MQGDKERSLGLPVSPLMDRNQQGDSLIASVSNLQVIVKGLNIDVRMSINSRTIVNMRSSSQVSLLLCFGKHATPCEWELSCTLRVPEYATLGLCALADCVLMPCYDSCMQVV